MADFEAGLTAEGVPGDEVELLRYLFTEVYGHNASLADGVQRALGREPRDFADYARDAAEGGVWNRSARSPSEMDGPLFVLPSPAS
ncbi:MAG: hypothetical protein H0U20_06740 [Thermoleophilaceae bacterium]|nr:hypothetical protein [Thermoleophilaceae bacterium]